MRRKVWTAMLIGLALAAAAAAKDHFYRIPLTDLSFKEGALPKAEDLWSSHPFSYPNPSATLDGPGEIYLEMTGGDRFVPEAYRALIRTPQAGPVTGRIMWPDPKADGLMQLKFTAQPSASSSGTPGQFYSVKARYYSELAGRGVAGTAWFRHEAMAARAAAGETTAGQDASEMQFRRFRNESDMDQTYSLFSGGRAVSENLQLDRTLNVAGAGDETATITLATVPGISTREMDWSKLNAGLKPKTDALAACIPYDQHAIFFPSFQAMLDVMDEARRDGTPVLRLVEERSEDARTRERTERQLCLAADALGRLIGPKVVAAVAFTGSDPYLRAGSDVAVLFQSVDVKVLAPLIVARQQLALSDPQVKPVKGEVSGVAWQGVLSPDRAVCSYMAVVKDVVVVTNSLYQLGRIVDAVQSLVPALNTTGEYTFFRERYKLGEADETGLVILSDQAIRRWCGPRWRIGASRRARAAAVLNELQARHLDELAQGKIPKNEKAPLAGEITWTKDGPVSSIYGTLAFMTPIAELPLDKATSDEVAAYGRFRDNYQRNWRYFFDPIAIRLTVTPERLATDLTVMPLILGSEFGRFVEVARGATLKPGSGDPHPEALLHLAFAIDKEAETIRQAGQMMSQMRGPAGQGLPAPNPLGWLGTAIAVYADDDPFWKELLGAKERNQFMEKNYRRLPLGVCIEVSDGLKLAVFLTTLRGLVEQTAPGLTRWGNEVYKGQPYVKITVSDRGADAATSASERLALYYASTPRALVVSLNEKLIQRALDRLTTATQPAGKAEWLGKQLAARAGRQGLELFQDLVGEGYRREMQQRAWSNIPILNEWRRRYPEQSPVDFHARFWQTRLTGPAGGDYTWNEAWQTMESTVYGHPGQPKAGPGLPESLRQAKGLAMGVTFENEGLRGRAAIERGK